MSTYPFFFWGRSPADWLEGANDGHLYEIRFREEPSPDVRLAIGAAFRAAMKKGPATAAEDAWLWSGPFVTFRVGEKRAGAAPRVFDHMETVLRAIHEAAPIAEVVFWGTRAAGRHPWDVWTREKARKPSAGPPWKGLEAAGLYGRVRDGRLAPGATDARFELARAGKKPPKISAAALTIEQVLPGESGWPKDADDVETGVKLPGSLRASRNAGDAVLALTSKEICLIEKKKVVARLPAKGAVQLAVTTTGIAVTMTPADVIRAYRFSRGALTALGEQKVKRGGSLWAKGARVFFSAGGSAYFEVKAG